MTQKAYNQALSALMNVQILALYEQITQQDKCQCEHMRDLFDLTAEPITALRAYAREYGFDEEPQV